MLMDPFAGLVHRFSFVVISLFRLSFYSNILGILKKKSHKPFIGNKSSHAPRQIYYQLIKQTPKLLMGHS